MKLILLLNLVFGFFWTQSTFTVIGSVRNPSGQTVDGVRVSVIDENFQPIRTIFVDSSGRFTVRGLGQGRFTFRVETTGMPYEEQSQQLELQALRVRGGNETFPLDIALKFKKEEGPGAERAAGPYATTSTASFQQNKNAINGIVTNTANRPLNRIRVELLDEVEMTITQTYTDTAGRYSFRNLSTGTFIVKAHSDGTYLGQSVRVSLYAARVGGGAHYEQLDIVLKTRDEAKGNSVPSNSGPAFAQEIPENAHKAYDRAVKQLENNKTTNQGIDSLKEAINLFPTYFLALERLGVEYIKLQQYQSAHATLTKAVEINPNGASCRYALGVSQFHLQKLPESIESLRRSLQLAPESPNAALAHFYLGLAFWNAGKAGDAEPHLKKAYQLGGNSIPPDVHMHLAKYYGDNKRYKEAADELELFLKLAPDARDAEKIKALIKQLRAKAASESTRQK